MANSTKLILDAFSELGKQLGDRFYFTGLKDCPSVYVGHSGDYLVVNDDESGIHFTGIEKIATDLTDYGFGTIPSYTDLPDVTENDGKIVASGCDLYHSCNGTWNKISSESIPPPDEAPACVTNLSEYNQYQEYKQQIFAEYQEQAFSNALNGIPANPIRDVCLFKQINNTSSSETINSNAISAGHEHTNYLKSDGTVWAAGRNDNGQLGDGTTKDRSNPVQVTNADGSEFGGVANVFAGYTHTAYLKSDGTVWATGYNNWGQLGNGEINSQQTNPVQAINADGTNLSGVVDISVGVYHTVYLKSDGTVWAVGRNNFGQLGDGTTTDRPNPVQVMNADGTALSGVVGISAGYDHTVYLKSDGTVWAVGRNDFGQLGDGTTQRRSDLVQVINVDGTALSGVVGISAGVYHTVYLKSDGTVWATGFNNWGQLGDRKITDRSIPVQVTNADGSEFGGAVGISAGYQHTVYLKSDGTVWAAGGNSAGQLGIGTTTGRNDVVQVKNADGSELSGVVGMSAGGTHSVFLKSDGSVWAVGENDYGQLGDGTTNNRPNLVQVTHADGSISGGATSTPSIEPSVKIIDSGYSWGIFEDDTTINIEATNGSCTFVEWRSSTSTLQDPSSNTTSATISADTSITGVFNC